MSLNTFKNYVMRRGIEQLLKEYVTNMVNLAIDPEKKTIQFTVELKGETAPIDIDVKKYELKDNEGRLFLVIHDLSISKEWMDVLASQMVKGKPIEIGSGSKKILEILKMLNMV